MRDAIFVLAAVLALLGAIFLGVLVLVVLAIGLLAVLATILVIHSNFLRNFFLAVFRLGSLPRISGFILGFEDEACK